MTTVQFALLIIFSGIGLLTTAGALTWLIMEWWQSFSSWWAFHRALRQARLEREELAARRALMRKEYQ